MSMTTLSVVFRRACAVLPLLLFALHQRYMACELSEFFLSERGGIAEVMLVTVSKQYTAAYPLLLCSHRSSPAQ